MASPLTSADPAGATGLLHRRKVPSIRFLRFSARGKRETRQQRGAQGLDGAQRSTCSKYPCANQTSSRGGDNDALLHALRRSRRVSDANPSPQYANQACTHSAIRPVRNELRLQRCKQHKPWCNVQLMQRCTLDRDVTRGNCVLTCLQPPGRIALQHPSSHGHSPDRPADGARWTGIGCGYTRLECG